MRCHVSAFLFSHCVLAQAVSRQDDGVIAHLSYVLRCVESSCSLLPADEEKPMSHHEVGSSKPTAALSHSKGWAFLLRAEIWCREGSRPLCDTHQVFVTSLAPEWAHCLLRDLSVSILPEIRLANGPSRCQGRVEILYNGSWGTVCDDDWDIVDANVVCRQLGCGHAITLPAAMTFGQGSGPIFLDNVDCKGWEAALSECWSHGWGIHNCYHYEDVAVVCNGNKAGFLGDKESREVTEELEALVSADTLVERKSCIPEPIPLSLAQPNLRCLLPQSFSSIQVTSQLSVLVLDRVTSLVCVPHHSQLRDFATSPARSLGKEHDPTHTPTSESAAAQLFFPLLTCLSLNR